MPRKPRQASISGFLHVIIRGIGRQILFEDKSDYLFFLSILKKYAIEESIKVCAYCLMENHVHLLVFDKEHNTAPFMKRIGITYASYYNQKYERVGHVFQDRFKSEPIDSVAYLRNVFRYILKNPEKAGICPASRYKWSSYKLYGRKDSFIDTGLVAEYIGDIGQYLQFLSEEENDTGLEFEPVRKTDSEAMRIIYDMGFESGTAIQALNREVRNKVICKLLNAGLSIRQIERITGISRGVIQRVKG